ncbi:hypothetical protein GMD78_11625 [Ornithinibacillus sp. L9]|uniref:ATP synthase A/B type C-terminal domain-containing protein n=1 Tax=Ornithinibacillus caprae TaxID=2678566 RepID=A0A6N8FHW0_9BACI|nr:helix-turn-helix domain-containing protein [Ornithinibacillus caprae]MUK89023.1 hypothetical protein [Ornithinibacillus caprae]
MKENIRLNVALLKRRVPNLTIAAKSVGLRPATVSNLTTGKISIAKSEVKTLVALATIADCTLDELIIRENDTEKIETGIKVLDLFAPLVRGGTAGLVARPGMGQLVLMAEIFHRLKKLHFTTLFLMPSEEIAGVNDVIEQVDYSSSYPDDIYNRVQEMNEESNIVIGVDRTMVVTGDLFDFQEKLQEATVRPVTIVLVDTLGEVVDEDLPYGPLETFWRFDMDLATRKMFPAVDPVVSTSSILEGAYLDSPHFSIQQRARKLLRRYKELTFIVDQWGIEKLSESDLLVYRRGQRLEAFLTQPFYVAEPVAKKKGEWVSLQDTIEQVRKVLDGVVDHKDVEDLLYVGGLDG